MRVGGRWQARRRPVRDALGRMRVAPMRRSRDALALSGPRRRLAPPLAESEPRLAPASESVVAPAAASTLVASETPAVAVPEALVARDCAGSASREAVELGVPLDRDTELRTPRLP